MTNSLRLLLTGDSILQRRLNSRDDAELRATLRERGFARYRATFAPAALQRTLHAAAQRLERA